MAQLIVRKLEDKVVRKLKERAAEYGVSMEEAHRRILRETLLEKKKPKMTFKEFLIAPPYWDDEMVRLVNNRRPDKPRPVDLG
jgi:hypothetical protein